MTTPASTDLTREECVELWNRLDYNGNGLLSLAELDKGVSEMWPSLDHKPAIMRAYKAADKNDDGFVRKNEFRRFMRYIHVFNQLWTQFAEADADGDRRLSKEECTEACAVLGIDGGEAEQAFEEMDKNNGGYVLFDEFCAYYVTREESGE